MDAKTTAALNRLKLALSWVGQEGMAPLRVFLDPASGTVELAVTVAASDLKLALDLIDSAGADGSE